MIIVLLVLIYILNIPAAFAGVGTTFLFIPPMLYLAGRFAKYRGKTASATDSRVRHISEIIDGIGQVKSYAWETPFFEMITKLRQKEIYLISRSQVLRAINQGLMYCTPAIVALVTFGVYWGAGGEMTVPKVFATISLLQVLRMTIGRMWTRSIETGSDAIASCLRIESFLDKVYGHNVDNNILAKAAQGTSAAYKSVSQHESGNQDEQKTGIALVEVPQKPVNSIADNTTDLTANGDKCLLHLKATKCFYSETPVLSNIDLTLQRGCVTMIVGPVGSGKSSLLSAILGEMKLSTDGTCVRAPDATVAYCAQRAWIVAASVKANVTIAGRNGHHEKNYKQPKSMDYELYARAVETCLLIDDMIGWAGYDETEIGERGVSISGGQRARISLARAVYADADIYLLDDPLSAVDAHVGQALMKNCIINNLRAQNKAVALVTHQLQYLPLADDIVVLNKVGEQVFRGSYSQFLQHPEVMEFLEVRGEESSQKTEETTSEDDTSDTKSPHAPTSTKPPSKYNRNFLQERRREAQELEIQRQENECKKRKRTMSGNESLPVSSKSDEESKGAITVSPEAAMVDAEDLEVVVESAEDAKRRQIIAVEEKKMGDISWEVYIQYLKAGGIVRGVSVLCFVLFSQALLMITDYWLRWWATSTFADQDSYTYLLVYGLLVGACIFTGFYRALAWFQFSLIAASTMHEQCFWAVLHSPLGFFISNPTGRILNRFAKDQNQADELLPVTLFTFLESLVFCLASVILICITIPWLILLMPPLIIVFIILRRKYMDSTREIKRWEAVTRSPIYADFSATLEGIVTLRAYALEEKVSTLFLQQLNDNGRAWFSFLMAARWLGFRLDCESAIILAFVSLFAVWLRSTLDVGLIGFALTYTMSLSGLFQWSVRLSAEVEAQMTSIERIHAFGELPAEPGYIHNGSLARHQEMIAEHRQSLLSLCIPTIHQEPTPSNRSTSSRDGAQTQVKPQQLDPHKSAIVVPTKGGEVQLRNLTVRYRVDLDPVLDDITLTIPPGKKVGICGRTGSGKSSTLLALLRLNLISAGDIRVDNLSILDMDLQAARSHIALIPQEPHLFSGTVRFNLDPFERHSDEELWAALKDAHFAEYLQQQPLKLAAPVDEGGKNFSVGQRQLLSLARAILRRCPVVLMDEVTASIDFQTDRLIQETIRTSPALRDATIITVAHRLRTIADSDFIVVIDFGHLAEMGSPLELLTSPEHSGSLYRLLAEQSGEMDEILRAAQQGKASNQATEASH